MAIVRALGPVSVASLLKIVLNLIYVLLWGLAAVLGLILLGLALFPVPIHLWLQQVMSKLQLHGIKGAIGLGLIATQFYLAGTLVIVGRLRKIFDTLTLGDPFHPENFRRLRIIGLGLAALELGRYGFLVTAALTLKGVADVSASVSLTAWSSVMVVFVLAEVFREGARLRREAELTI